MIEKINIFSDKKLTKCFLFFFLASICGYLSIMTSFCPYNDDFCRYVVNSHVGTLSAARYLTRFLETFIYLSHVITDAAPFTQVVSCAFLAYATTICLKIFNVDTKDKWKILCFVPVSVNPYMLEVMMYRFDNPYITLALLITVIAAYLASFNKREYVPIAVCLLVCALFMYQPALFAFFLIFSISFLRFICDGMQFSAIISKMKYSIYTLLIVTCVYLPVTYIMTYCVSENDGSLFIIPSNLENIRAISEKLRGYFSIIYTDWGQNAVGTLFFSLFAIFSLNTLAKAFERTKSILYTLLTALTIFICILCPAGTCLFIRIVSFEGNESIFPRIMYSVGILISLVLYSNSKLFDVNKITKCFYNLLTVSFVIWNFVFTNSTGNIVHIFRNLQRHVFYDMAKDIDNALSENKKITHVCVVGSVTSAAMTNFVKLYPIIDRIIPEKWGAPVYSWIALMSPTFANCFLQYVPLCEVYDADKYKKTAILKKHMHYEMKLLDEKVLFIQMPEASKFEDTHQLIARVRD